MRRPTLTAKKLLEQASLYIILDQEVADTYGLSLLRSAVSAARSGASIFQLRAKHLDGAQFLKEAVAVGMRLRQEGRLFLVNDRVDIAQACQSDGVHLGRDDIPVAAARKILGPKKVIGKTCHSLGEFRAFQKEDVDYVSFGPVFKTKTKPELAALDKRTIKSIVKQACKPTFAIGGITVRNLSALKACGVSRVAICREVLLSNSMTKTVGALQKCLSKVS